MTSGLLATNSVATIMPKHKNHAARCQLNLTGFTSLAVPGWLYRSDGVVVRASASWSVELGLIP